MGRIGLGVSVVDLVGWFELRGGSKDSVSKSGCVTSLYAKFSQAKAVGIRSWLADDPQSAPSVFRKQLHYTFMCSQGYERRDRLIISFHPGSTSPRARINFAIPIFAERKKGVRPLLSSELGLTSRRFMKSVTTPR